MTTKELLTIFPRIRVIWVKNENTKNNQSSDVVNPSPFLLFGYPIIKGFSLESMHTIEHGAFGRAINGLACEKKYS